MPVSKSNKVFADSSFSVEQQLIPLTQSLTGKNSCRVQSAGGRVFLTFGCWSLFPLEWLRRGGRTVQGDSWAHDLGSYTCLYVTREFQTGQWTILEAKESWGFLKTQWTTRGHHVVVYDGIWQFNVSTLSDSFSFQDGNKLHFKFPLSKSTLDQTGWRSTFSRGWHSTETSEFNIDWTWNIKEWLRVLVLW